MENVCNSNGTPKKKSRERAIPRRLLPRKLESKTSPPQGSLQNANSLLQNLGATAAALEEALAQAKSDDVNPVPAEPGAVTGTTPTDTEHKPKWVNRYSDTVADAGDTAEVDTTLAWDVEA